MAISALLIAAARTAARASAGCPDGIAIGETIEGETVCERLDGTGDLIFLNTDGSEQRRVAKSYSALYDSNASEAYLGFNKSQWGTNSGPDVLGNALISRSSPGDPSCASCPSSDHLRMIAYISLTAPDRGTGRLVASAVPPMRYDGGYDAKDPAHGGRGAQAGSHTFVGSRASSVWAVFDTYGTSPSGMGTPNMKCAQRSTHCWNLQADLLNSMARSKIPSVNGSNNGVACRPHVAGWTCDGMHSHPVGHDSYRFPTLDVFCTGRTYPEAFYSGVLPADAVSDIANWAAKNDGVFTVPQQWCTFSDMYIIYMARVHT